MRARADLALTSPPAYLRYVGVELQPHRIKVLIVKTAGVGLTWVRELKKVAPKPPPSRN